MLQLYPRAFGLTLLFTLLSCTCVLAQRTNVAVMDFDGTTPEIPVSTSLPFFDNGSDGFYGIHNANGDATDGTPMDTGVGNNFDVNKVSDDPIAGDFLFLNDLNDEGDNGGPEVLLTFGPVDVTGLTNLLFSFDYQVDGFDNTDDAFYQLITDGTATAEELFIEGGTPSGTAAGRIDIAIPDGTMMATLTIRILQNGDDALGLDNFAVTSNASADPCGIVSFGPAEAICISESPAGRTDSFEIRIPYVGLDDDATLFIEAGVTTPARDVTASVRNIGDDPTMVADGVIILRNNAADPNDGFIEENEVRITLSDGGGDCSFVELVSTTNNQCVNPCDPNINPDNIIFNCDARTENMDMGSATVPFTNGPEPGVVVTVNNGATVDAAGDDPATDETGDLLITGLVEGTTYTITLTGGGCVDAQVKTIDFTFTDGTCIASPLVINEFLADPDDATDVNQDNMTGNQRDEFVEIFNTSNTPIDISGYTVGDENGPRFTFPSGATIGARSAVVVFGQAPTQSAFGCPVYGSGSLGLNNSGDEVNVRNAAGGLIAQVAFTSSTNDVSSARNPDFTGDFVNHTNISSNAVNFSPCESNTTPGLVLPVTLTSLTAVQTAKSVNVHWSTEREVNNDYFVVDRSSNGINWSELGMVAAAGTDAAAYSFADDAPLSGMNYYRLRQYDVDGTMSVHGPVQTRFAGEGLSVFPNPVNDLLSFSRSLAEGASVTVTDVNGRLITEAKVSPAGLDVRQLRGGMYLITVQEGDSVPQVIRFVKR